MTSSNYGIPFPLGATRLANGWNFAIYSENPVSELVVAPLLLPMDISSHTLDPVKNRTANVWHYFLQTDETELLYSFCTGDALLVDPYAKLLATGSKFGDNSWTQKRYKTEPIGIAFVDADARLDLANSPKLAISDLIIYEMHVRGLTKDRSSHVKASGSYLGVIEKIPYLKQLGITAVELLPIFEFDETENYNVNPKTKQPLYNYWGYSPLSFFSPMQRYSTNDEPLEALKECRQMIKAFHEADIQVIIDVVYNHTGEGNELGPVISWKGFSVATYYLKDNLGHFLNFSGCGNTCNANHPVDQDLFIDSLRYWAVAMGVDGFRFDLASILMRGQDGRMLERAPLLERITQDPILSKLKLIAEPWDAVGAHQVGSFYQSPWPRSEQFMEWNDDYRSTVRQFIKGTPGYAGKFATKLCGSQDLYGREGSPLNSVNFVSCHDGFSLRDVVSYQQKHNEENGENNRDGVLTYDTWNCGQEGETPDTHIEVLRQRQMKNFCIALLVSLGVPMFLMGDEYGHTKRGNNNSWCQDNEINWFDWKALDANQTLFSFWKQMIHFRRRHALLRRNTFLSKDEIIWHGHVPNTPDWGYESQFVAYTLIDKTNQEDLYIAFNASNSLAVVQLPILAKERAWAIIANTSSLPPQDIFDEACLHRLATTEMKMLPYSSLLLKSISRKDLS